VLRPLFVVKCPVDNCRLSRGSLGHLTHMPTNNVKGLFHGRLESLQWAHLTEHHHRGLPCVAQFVDGSGSARCD